MKILIYCLLFIVVFVLLTYVIFTKNKIKEDVVITNENEVKDTVFITSTINIHGDTTIHGYGRIYKYAPDTFNIYLKPSDGIVFFETKIEGESK